MLKKWLDDAIKNGNIRSINYKDFYNISPVARDASSEVLKAYWTNGESFVALKTHSPASGSKESLDNFVREVIVSKKPVNVVNNCLNTPNSSTLIAPPLSQVNANMAGMSINDQNCFDMNNNNTNARQTELLGSAQNINKELTAVSLRKFRSWICKG
ncbi:24989_t:CDS:2 [Cetraspora pellucida]|uniref:24989_t:CDS:1 n=1 Tax=Cetraspora pellucida TaxID=1433469 RepID=A0A9N9EPY3_9GLOM|nr:24989_t:CDS:2 [Cetraspora pellucida]